MEHIYTISSNTMHGFRLVLMAMSGNNVMGTMDMAVGTADKIRQYVREHDIWVAFGSDFHAIADWSAEDLQFVHNTVQEVNLNGGGNWKIRRVQTDTKRILLGFQEGKDETRYWAKFGKSDNGQWTLEVGNATFYAPRAAQSPHEMMKFLIGAFKSL